MFVQQRDIFYVHKSLNNPSIRNSPQFKWNLEMFSVFSYCFLDFFVGVGAFVIGLSHISSFFSDFEK